MTAVAALLSPIEKGRISVVKHPPPMWDTDALAEWDHEQNQVTKKDSLGMLDYCIEELAKHRRSEANKEAFVDRLIYDDLRQMEANPAVHSSYRRFVIIYEDTHEWSSKDEMNADGVSDKYPAAYLRVLTWMKFERVFPQAFKFGDVDDLLLSANATLAGGLLSTKVANSAP